MRNAFIEELVSLAHVNKNIVLIVGDIGYSVVEIFANSFPDRFINAGVAEQNMTTLAAGMASEGYHVFTYSIANFPTFRCAEQIRNDVDYHNLPVTVVAVGGGLSYGALGYSHHAIQDYSLIRGMPNMLIASPGDPMEVRACLRYLVDNPQPSYLRLGKSGEPSFHKDVPSIKPGDWLKVESGNNNALLCTGATLELGMKLRNDSSYYSDFSVYSMPLWGMKFKSIQPFNISKFSNVITLEDHLEDGGFGSWILESLSTQSGLRSKVEIKALNSIVCGSVASQRVLNQLGGLGLVP
jgi:transketolase